MFIVAQMLWRVRSWQWRNREPLADLLQDVLEIFNINMATQPSIFSWFGKLLVHNNRYRQAFTYDEVKWSASRKTGGWHPASINSLDLSCVDLLPMAQPRIIAQLQPLRVPRHCSFGGWTWLEHNRFRKHRQVRGWISFRCPEFLPPPIVTA